MSYLSYDSRGKAGRKVDGPQDLTFSFDRAERLTQVRETGGSLRVMESRTYGTGTASSDRSLGKLKTATRNNYHERFGVNFPSVSTYTYGGRDGRVSSLLHTINTNDSYTQTYVWNELGNLASQTYPTCNHCPVGTVPSRTVSYTYTQGFLTAVPNWATSITYHPNGLVNQITHANTVVSTQANDPYRMKRPASIRVALGTTTLFTTGTYAYDGSGNVSKIGSDYYLYDRLGRLKEGTALQAGSSNRQTYGYDGFGNLTSTTSWVNGSGTTRTNAVVGTTNRLSAAGYDAAGNQTTWGTYGYTWDLMGLMKAYQGSGNDWAYAYDVDDERMLVYNVVTGQSTFRIRGLNGKVLREVKLSGGVWSWGKDWIYRDGQLLATTAPGSVTRYAHADHLGSPRLLTDASGVVKERYHYYPFGEQAGTAPLAPEALRFTGHERDLGSSTGTADDLDYMHARYYQPQLGRFLSVDPANRALLQVGSSWNRYVYSRNNPIRFWDPDGRQEQSTTQVQTPVKSGFWDFLQGLFGLGSNNMMVSNAVYMDGKFRSTSLNPSDMQKMIGIATVVTVVVRTTLPSDAQQALDEIETGADRPNVRNPKPFKNDGRGSTAILPTHDEDGNPITYTEHTVNPREPGKPLDQKRFVTASDGNVYYTDDHFVTLHHVEEKTQLE